MYNKYYENIVINENLLLQFNKIFFYNENLYINIIIMIYIILFYKINFIESNNIFHNSVLCITNDYNTQNGIMENTMSKIIKFFYYMFRAILGD